MLKSLKGFLVSSRAEVSRITWPSGRETMVTTGLVLALVTVVSIALFALDSAIGFSMRAIFSIGA